MNRSKPSLKICGLQPGDDLSFTKEACVEFVGIIFVSESRRYVDPAAARTIVDNARCPVVGVFSNARVNEIEDVVRKTGIAVAQLHGDESPEVCAQLRHDGVTVWKSIAVAGDGSNIDDVRRDIRRYRTVTNALLFDTKPVEGEVVTGGHGKSFDWRALVEVAEDLNGLAWWVAGGIQPDNVSRLLEQVCPYGMDVSSGVESGGRKDNERIRQLIEAVMKS